VPGTDIFPLELGNSERDLSSFPFPTVLQVTGADSWPALLQWASSQNIARWVTSVILLFLAFLTCPDNNIADLQI